MLVDSKASALVTLLGDNDERVRKIARKKLLEYGRELIPFLREIAQSDNEGIIRIEAQMLLEESRLQELTQKFVSLNQARKLDLEGACFILAKIEYADLDIPKYKRQLDELSKEAGEVTSTVTSEMQQSIILGKFLFDEKGFRGNSESYYDPQNSYINRVLDRHLGIPISLSALYLFVAKRLEIPVKGVGFPGHFLLRFSNAQTTFFIDPFNQGRILSQDDCKALINKMGYEFSDYYMNESKPRDILSRMIRNLVIVFLEANQPKKIETLERIFSDIIE